VHGCLSVVSVVCCQVEVSVTSWSLVLRSPTERGVSISVIVKRRTMMRPRPPKGCRAIGGNLTLWHLGFIQIMYKNSVSFSQITYCIFITETSVFIQFREIIAVY
jgi:hypothetical protein